MSDLNLTHILAAVDDIGLTMPAPVLDARKMLAATENLAAKVAAETPPAAPTKPAGLAAYLDTVVAYEATHEARTRHAARLVDTARSDVNAAQAAACSGWQPDLADAFDRIADKLATTLPFLAGHLDRGAAAIAGLDVEWTEANELVTRLSMLARARDAYAFRGGLAATASSAFER